MFTSCWFWGEIVFLPPLLKTYPLLAMDGQKHCANSTLLYDFYGWEDNHYTTTTNAGSVYILTQIQQFKRGDEVAVKSDKKLVKELQEGHGGWNEAMISVSFYSYRLFVCWLSSPIPLRTISY